jgi:hypothetical protein
VIPVTCGGCGIEYAIPDALYSDLKATGRGFTCPNGCRRHFIVEPTAEQKRIALLEGWLEDSRRRAMDWHGATEDAYRELRRCPICGESTGRARSFDKIRVRLAEHLTIEHGARARLRAIERETGVAK